MKVKCIKTSIDKPLLGSINYDVHDYLEIGDSFFVYGIRFVESDIYVYIYNGNHLFFTVCLTRLADGTLVLL